MKRKLVLIVAAVTILVLSLGGVASAQTDDNIVDIAAKNSNFSTLHAAIVAAGLADTLASANNMFTVFAPTNRAFAALEAANPGILAAVLADPKGLLTDILTYHVVAGKLLSGDVLASTQLTTVNGAPLKISLRNGEPYVNDSKIVTVDIPAKNGVIHVIDAVLVPPAEAAAPASQPAQTGSEAAMAAEVAAGDAPDDTSDQTIAEIAEEAGFTKLLEALTATGLAETFTKPGNYTVFAPTNEAFEALEGSFTQDELTAILLYHVVNDRLTRDQIATDDLIPTLSGGRPLFVNASNGIIEDISGANVVVFDIPASNGIIHVIDTVMVP